jgi:DNA-binding transcriptional MerR regulator
VRATAGEEHTLSLGTLVRETGLRPDTLRAWEQRYGVPSPGRGPGGHRLYSAADLARLKWLVARLQEGMRIGEAVRLLRRVGEPVAEPRAAAGVDALRAAWVDACLSFDEGRAEAAANEGFARYPVEVACVDLLVRGLVEIGLGWETGHVAVQQEHFASNLAQRRVAALLAAAPPPLRPGRFWVGCAPGEDHAFSSLVFTLLLRRRAWPVVFLGADVPAEELATVARRDRPGAVVIAAHQLHTARGLAAQAAALAGAGPTVGYGGRVFVDRPALRARIPAHYLGDSLLEAAEDAERLIGSRPPAPPVPPPDPALLGALDLYRRRRAAVEAEVWAELGDLEPHAGVLVAALARLGRDVEAALDLGDATLLDLADDPLLGLDVPNRPAVRDRIVGAYARAAARALDDRAAPLLGALRRRTGTGA